MQKEVLYGIIGLLAGSLLTIVFATSAVNTNNTGMMWGSEKPVTGMMNGMGMGSSMDDMMGFMRGKTGDAFDRAFLSAMIIHHEGAIDMAKEARVSAKHEEIKKLADDIIFAQTKEINQMKEWQKAWGY